MTRKRTKQFDLDPYVPDFLQENPASSATHSSELSVNRRSFFKLSGIAGGGLVLGFSLGGNKQALAQGIEGQVTNDYVQIRPDGTIILMSSQPDVGQGVKTAFPMLIAEELDANWADVEVVQSEIDAQRYGSQQAAGSRGTQTVWNPLRQAGATVRAMLLSAAAIQLSVDESELRTQDSIVFHDASDREIPYGELTELASTLEVPAVDSLRLKERSEWSLIGQRISGVDNHKIVTGKPLYGMDQEQPNMLFATFVKSRQIGAKAELANLDFIKTLNGVVDAFIMEENGLPNEYVRVMPTIHSGVVIVARSTWSALSAARQLEVRWDTSTAVTDSWTDHVTAAQALAQSQGEETLSDKGEVDNIFANASAIVEGFYTYPFLSHADLEPQNCTAWVKEDGVEVWAPTQTPQRAVSEVAAFLEIPEDSVHLNQLRGGGGFGRRLANDSVVEAVAIAARYDVPVKAFWTREDDFSFDFYRPGGFHSFKGAIDSEGKLAAWQDHFITFSRPGSTAPLRSANMSPNEFPVSVLDNARITQTTLKSGMPSGPMRAPGSNAIAFAVESFLHECSVAAGRDHVEFLLEVIGDPRWLEEGNIGALNTERAANVIRLAAEQAGWGRQMPAGRGLGLAFHFSHAAHFAQVAEVSVDENNKVTVHKVTVAGDVGPIVNLSGALNQVEGSVIDAISGLLGLEISFVKGRVDQQNFHQYPLGRIGMTPEIDVHFIESEYDPTGLGEPAYPPTIPAVTNAIFAATGHRIRTLPITKEGFIS